MDSQEYEEHRQMTVFLFICHRVISSITSNLGGGKFGGIITSRDSSAKPSSTTGDLWSCNLVIVFLQ